MGFYTMPVQILYYARAQRAERRPPKVGLINYKRITRSIVVIMDRSRSLHCKASSVAIILCEVILPLMLDMVAKEFIVACR